MTKRTKMRAPRAMPDLLQEGLAGLGLAERLREADIWRLWPEVVGPTVASRAQPLRIINGTLTVAVSSAPWMQELRFLTGIMKAKLNDRLGGEVIKEITLKSGNVEYAVPGREDEKPRKKPLTARQKAFIAEQSSAISDTEVRDAFAALMKASLSRVS